MTGAAHLIQTLFWRKTKLLWFARLLALLIPGGIYTEKHMYIVYDSLQTS